MGYDTRFMGYIAKEGLIDAIHVDWRRFGANEK